jgi:lysophospholipase L1-like esterase
MMNVDLSAPDRPLRFEGVLDVSPTPSGVRLSRLPARAQARIFELPLTWTASVPSGGRIEFVTDSRSLELDVQLLRVSMGDQAPRPAAFDLVVDGEVQDPVLSDSGHVARYTGRNYTDVELIRGAPATIRFEGLSTGRKRLELWLPHNASLDLRALRVDDGASVEAGRGEGRRWVHYGSSISHCMEAERPTGVWPVVAARQAGVNLMSLGLAGQAQLDQVVARTIRDVPADLISLKVGINLVNADSMRERTFVPAVQGFIDTIRDGHPHTPMLLITPIICPVAEEHPGPTLTDPQGRTYVVERPEDLVPGALTLTRIRQLLGMVVERLSQQGDVNLHLMSGLDLFGPADVGDLPDGLHPNPAGYRRMGERFYQAAFAEGGVFQAS